MRTSLSIFSLLLLLLLPLFFNTFSSSADESALKQDFGDLRIEKWESGKIRAHLFMLDGNVKEVAIAAFSAGCDGYWDDGVRYSKGEATTTIKLAEIKYLVPMAGAGKLKDGKAFKNESLELKLCRDAYLSGSQPEWTKGLGQTMWFDREIKVALKDVKVIGFSEAWMNEGLEASKSLPIEDMVFVPGGCFQMGDSFGGGDGDEKPVHEVCVDDFYIGRYEVKQNEWWNLMDSHPSYLFRGCYDCPVEAVSWNDVQIFIQKINNMKGQNYRLPTEAEWEYAARSGGKAEKWAGTSRESDLGNYAWYGMSSPRRAGKKRPNGLGIYDMSGNVWEWVSDRYGENYYISAPRSNPGGALSGSYRVVRGGGFYYEPRYLRTTLRFGVNPDLRESAFGFRLARTP